MRMCCVHSGVKRFVSCPTTTPCTTTFPYPFPPFFIAHLLCCMCCDYSMCSGTNGIFSLWPSVSLATIACGHHMICGISHRHTLLFHLMHRTVCACALVIAIDTRGMVQCTQIEISAGRTELRAVTSVPLGHAFVSVTVNPILSCAIDAAGASQCW